MLSITQKIELATEEVKQAETLVRVTRVDVQKWEDLLELRQENLRKLEREAKDKKAL